MTGRPTIDASALPADALGPRTPAWWGNTLFMCIETSTVCLLLASYFYLWRNFTLSQWPPPRVDREPALYRALPDLLFGTLNTVLLLATVPLAVWASRACRRRFEELERLNASKPSEVPEQERPAERPTGILVALLALTVLGGVSVALRWYEFGGLNVKWNANAYASIVWSLLVVHLIYIVIEVIEFATMLLWSGIYGVGQNQAGDVILTVDYWYWTVGVWVVIYGVVYWFPRVA